MNKIRRTSTTTLYQGYQANIQFNKSPIRRNNVNQVNPNKSPIRSRTPTKDISPIKTNNQHQAHIRFISNVSPIKEKQADLENYGQFSNGKSVKYINNNINDKIYQTIKKDKNQQFNKKSDRVMQQQNRLFGKLVDKLNSEKKTVPKSNQNSYKTSIFGDTSDTKSNRMEQTVTKHEGGTFREFFTQGKTGENRQQIKNVSKNKDTSVIQQEQNLSCLVYKIKNNNNNNKQREQQRQKVNEVPKTIQKTAAANTPSILLKRKFSKNEQENVKQIEPLPKTGNRNKDDEEDYSELNMLLKKIQQGCKSNPKHLNEDIVKMSFRLQQSLNMDPFI